MFVIDNFGLDHPSILQVANFTNDHIGNDSLILPRNDLSDLTVLFINGDIDKFFDINKGVGLEDVFEEGFAAHDDQFAGQEREGVEFLDFHQAYFTGLGDFLDE